MYVLLHKDGGNELSSILYRHYIFYYPVWIFITKLQSIRHEVQLPDVCLVYIFPKSENTRHTSISFDYIFQADEVTNISLRG